jgi:hypothetical protein
MAMGRRRKRVRQEGLWTPTAALPVGASHPFYRRLNQILDEKKFDEYVADVCQRFTLAKWAELAWRRGSTSGCLMVCYFEGIDSERGINIYMTGAGCIRSRLLRAARRRNSAI